MFEHDLLEQALAAFRRETGLRVEILAAEPRTDDHTVDAAIEFPEHGGHFLVEVKKWAQQANLGALINQVRSLPGRGLLVADYVNPNMAQALREQDVQFLDTAGNAYLNQPPLFIFVTGKKNPGQPKKMREGPNRAFDVAGLKVIFGLLCDPALAAQPYRAIADRAGVALGTVDWPAIARGFGTASFAAASDAELARALDQATRVPGPSLIEAHIDGSNYARTLEVVRG